MQKLGENMMNSTGASARLAQDPAREGSARGDILALIRGVARRHRSLVNRISKIEMNASFIEYELFQLLKLIEQHFGEDANGAVRTATSDNRDSQESLRYLAETGVGAVHVAARADGLSDVRIDGGKSFTLPPILADLLGALASDSGFSEDAFVGWKSVDEIVKHLSIQTGKPVSKRALTQNIYRLRRELFSRGGVNPFLIQTNRRRGLRFALRRKQLATSAISGD